MRWRGGIDVARRCRVVDVGTLSVSEAGVLAVAVKRLLFGKTLPGLSFAQTKLFISQESVAKSRRRRWPSIGFVKLTGASWARREISEAPSTSCWR